MASKCYQWYGLVATPLLGKCCWKFNEVDASKQVLLSRCVCVAKSHLLIYYIVLCTAMVALVFVITMITVAIE